MHTGWDDEQQRKIDTADELTAENAALRAQLAEAKNLLRNLPGMMGGDDWVDFLDPNDERYVLIIISRLAGTQEVKR